jgi:inner membrane protein
VFVFAHTGIALGAAALLNGFCGSRQENEATETDECAAPTAAKLRSVEAWLVSLGRRIDLRVLLIGALLPDIIDKPAGLLVYGTIWCRLFSHSLLFLALIAGAGFILYARWHKNWLLVLAFGVFMHLVLDEMWLDMHTLLWPAQGFSFPSVYLPDPGQGTPPEQEMAKVLISELVGLVVLGWFAWLLVRRAKLYAFIRYGQV